MNLCCPCENGFLITGVDTGEKEESQPLLMLSGLSTFVLFPRGPRGTKTSIDTRAMLLNFPNSEIKKLLVYKLTSVL